MIAILSVLAALLLPVFARVRETARATSCLSNLRQVGAAVTLYLQDYDETFPMSRLPDATHPPTGCIVRGNEPSDGLEGGSLNWKRELAPYVRSTPVLQCPSNGYAWQPSGFSNTPGDETNAYYPRSAWLPASYAYNGSFFHEAVPACWYGEALVRPRYLPEVAAPASLILLLESRYSYPDLGGWFIPQRGPAGGAQGPFQSHNGACNWLFADQHAKRVKLAATCRDRMWTDTFPDRAGGCDRLNGIADEYR